MRRTLILAVALVAAMLLVPDHANAADRWQPSPGVSWQWQLAGTVDTTVKADVFDIDGQEATASLVATLHAKGARVIAYTDLAWENYRPDAKAFPKSVLGKTMAGWPDERYVDVRQINVLLPIMHARFVSFKAKGADGVEFDLDDTYTAKTGFPLTMADSEAYDRALAADAHSLGLAVFLKNGITEAKTASGFDSFLPDMQPEVDGTVVEECHAYGECSAEAPFVAAGKPVLNAEYTGDRETLPKMCPAARGFSEILKHVSLNAWRQTC